MDLPNLENYPVYILNVVPEISDEDNLQIPQQITPSEPLPYNFYVPNIEHQAPILNTDNVQEIVPRTSNNKALGSKLLSKKNVQNTTYNQHVK